MKPVEPFLRHILEETEYLLKNSQSLEYQDFIRNETLKRSFVRALEVIGEAVKNLPLNFRHQHPQIPWKSMAGLRDILIHQYFGIDYRTVWDIVKNKIPSYKNQIEELLRDVRL